MKVGGGHLAHAIGGLSRQVDLVQAEEVVAVLALLAPAGTHHEQVTGVRLVVQRVPEAGIIREMRL